MSTIKGINVTDLYKYKGKNKFDDGYGDKGMEGSFGITDNRLVWYTRGSDAKLFDWGNNALFLPNTKGIHWGFYYVANRFSKSEKSNDLKEAIKNNDRIIIAAHSRGCGDAFSFMWINRNLFIQKKEIIIVFFGAPNFATRSRIKKFNKFFNNITIKYSFDNDNDPVTGHPWILSGFPYYKLPNNKDFFIKDHLEYGKATKELGIYV